MALYNVRPAVHELQGRLLPLMCINGMFETICRPARILYAGLLGRGFQPHYRRNFSRDNFSIWQILQSVGTVNTLRD